MLRRFALVAIAVAACSLSYRAQAQTCNQASPPDLCIDPISWNIIGLDSNKAVPPNSDGPDTFMVGARACNMGSTTLTDVVATYNTVGAVNPYINLADNSTITRAEIKPDRCEDFYFNGQITRVNAAYFTSQGYTVTATSGALSAVTPANRSLYIEKLNSQNRNTVSGLTGPTSLQVGGIYTFNVLWSTAPGGYEQLEHFVNLANTSFRLLSSYSVYDQPTAAVNTTIYADACGWDNNILSGTYRSCIGPENYPGGKTGGNVNTYFTVQILGATPIAGAQLKALIYDFSGSSYHYNTDYNSGTSGLTVVANAASDMQVTISDSPDPVAAGAVITYTGTVTNAGLSPVTTTDGGFLKIPIPLDTTFNSITMPGWTCGLASGVATCTPNSTFASGMSASYTLSVTVDASPIAGTVIQATATVGSNHEDPTPSNNLASTTTIVVGATDVDLSITNTVPAVVVQGSAFSFTQTVTNNGPATADDPEFTTQVPAGSTFNSITAPPGWTCGAPVSGSITCTGSSAMAVGASAVFSLNLTASGAVGTNLSSQAWTETSTYEPYIPNNVATASTNIIAANSADVAIVVSDFPDPVVPGESIQYTQTVTNNGVIPAQNVTVSFPTPANTVYSYIDWPAGWSCSTSPAPGTPTPGSAGTITCTKATMAVGETASFPLTVSVLAATPIGTIINYTATVSTTTTDSIAANNTSSTSTLVGSATSADVEIVKTTSANPLRVADMLVYTLRVTNNGPATATNVAVSDPLPSNLTFDSVVTSRGTCSYNAGTRTISCAVGTLTNGQVAAINIRTSIDAGASSLTLTNTATVSATQTDPVMSNNTSSAPVTVLSATATKGLRSRATQSGNTVDLSWTTSWERNNLGFNVYRETGAARVRVNKALIAGSTLLAGAQVPAGFSYRWTDRGPVSGSVYWIESVDLDGTKKLHGPVTPQLASLTSRALTTNAAQDVADSPTLADFRKSSAAPREIETHAAPRGVSEVTLARQFELAGQDAAKIRVSTEGYYRVTRAQLLAAGFDPGSEPRVLSLYVDAQEIPIAVNDGGDGKFDANDYLEFYAVGMDTTYSGTRAYWLVKGSNGLRFKPKAKVKGTPLTAQSFPYTLERKERFIFFAAQPNAVDRDSFYGSVIYSEPTIQSFEVSNLAPGSATLTVTAQGATLMNHHVSVRVNGTLAGTIDFYGQESGTSTFTIPGSVLRAGRNDVALAGSDGFWDVSFVDSLRLTYPHAYAADSNALRFPATGSREVTVSGFSGSDIRVIDVTDPYEPQEVESRIVANGGTYSLVAIPHESGERVLYATTISSAAPPASIGANRASTISARSNAADFVIISHAKFIDALAPLVAKRKAEGIETTVVDVEDVFDEYGYGSKSPDAIRDFLRSAQTRWRKAPRFAMLVGDASFDPRNYIGYGDLDFVPTRYLPTVYMKAASDNWLVDFDGDGLPNMYLGRLSVRTEEDAQNIVDKLVSYTPPATKRVVLVVDQNDRTFSFSDAATGVRNSIPDAYAVDDFNVTSYADKPALLSALNDNPTIVNYIGHGSIDGWSNTAVLMTDDAASLSGSGSTPLYLMMTCLNSLFADVWTTSIGETLLRVPNGGALAVFASSGMADPPPQALMNEQLYRILAANPTISIGELVARAKAGTPDHSVRTTWNLLGDPTMQLQK